MYFQIQDQMGEASCPQISRIRHGERRICRYQYSNVQAAYEYLAENKVSKGIGKYQALQTAELEGIHLRLAEIRA